MRFQRIEGDMNLHRRRCRFKGIQWLYLTSFVAFIILFAIVFRLLYEQTPCSDDELMQSFNLICSHYNQGAITGNLCEELCLKKAISYKKCLNRKDGKLVVLSEMNNVEIMIKATKSNIEDILTTSIDPMPDYDLLTEMIHERLKYVGWALNTDRTEPINFLWFDDFNASVAGSTYQAAALSLWSLLMQDEYVILRLLQGHKYIPNLYGSCGHLYMVENSPVNDLLKFDLKNLVFSQMNKENWATRVNISLQLLEMTRYLQEEMPYQLQLCDAKGNNFGLTKSGSVKLIDTDMAKFNQALVQIYASTSKCSTSLDCNFFDCKATCDTYLNRCRPQRDNTNIQTICHNILSSNFLSNLGNGLLRTPPESIKSKLENLLGFCSSMDNVQSSSYSQDRERKVRDELISLLKSSLKPD